MTIERINEDLLHEFWTDLDEMTEDIQENGYEVLEANEEYIAIADEENEDEAILLYIGHANKTMWIERIR